jgi:large subunit ribosomal protein L15
MMAHDASPSRGARKSRKRVGRGDGSGHGSYSGRGVKGQKSRSGGRVRPGFEGGQVPLIKGLPMLRGFTNIFKKRYALVKVGELAAFPQDSDVSPQSLMESGYLRSLRYPVKVLGDGEIGVALHVTAQSFTRSAQRKIEAAGGRVEVI